jgi:hypothetical protein
MKRKLFDTDPTNEIKLPRFKNQHHNYQRSQAMKQNLESIGLTDTPENNKRITNHLLEVGKTATLNNRIWIPSVLEGPNGKLPVNSTWKILDDGKKYLTTLLFQPINQGY